MVIIANLTLTTKDGHSHKEQIPNTSDNNRIRNVSRTINKQTKDLMSIIKAVEPTYAYRHNNAVVTCSVTQRQFNARKLGGHGACVPNKLIEGNAPFSNN